MLIDVSKHERQSRSSCKEMQAVECLQLERDLAEGLNVREDVAGSGLKQVFVGELERVRRGWWKLD